MKIKLGQLVKDDLGNVFRVIEEIRHWHHPEDFGYVLSEQKPYQGRIGYCDSKGFFHSGYNGHGTKIISAVHDLYCDGELPEGLLPASNGRIHNPLLG